MRDRREEGRGGKEDVREEGKGKWCVHVDVHMMCTCIIREHAHHYERETDRADAEGKSDVHYGACSRRRLSTGACV